MVGLVGALGTLYTKTAGGDIAPRHALLVIVRPKQRENSRPRWEKEVPEPAFFHLRTHQLRTSLVQTWNHMVELVGALGTLHIKKADGVIAHRHVQLVMHSVYPYLY